MDVRVSLSWHKLTSALLITSVATPIFPSVSLQFLVANVALRALSLFKAFQENSQENWDRNVISLFALWILPSPARYLFSALIDLYSLVFYFNSQNQGDPMSHNVQLSPRNQDPNNPYQLVPVDTSEARADGNHSLPQSFSWKDLFFGSAVYYGASCFNDNPYVIFPVAAGAYATGTYLATKYITPLMQHVNSLFQATQQRESASSMLPHIQLNSPHNPNCVKDAVELLQLGTNYTKAQVKENYERQTRNPLNGIWKVLCLPSSKFTPEHPVISANLQIVEQHTLAKCTLLASLKDPQMELDEAQKLLNLQKLSKESIHEAVQKNLNLIFQDPASLVANSDQRIVQNQQTFTTNLINCFIAESTLLSSLNTNNV